MTFRYDPHRDTPVLHGSPQFWACEPRRYPEPAHLREEQIVADMDREQWERDNAEYMQRTAEADQIKANNQLTEIANEDHDERQTRNGNHPRQSGTEDVA